MTGPRIAAEDVDQAVPAPLLGDHPAPLERLCRPRSQRWGRRRGAEELAHAWVGQVAGTEAAREEVRLGEDVASELAEFDVVGRRVLRVEFQACSLEVLHPVAWGYHGEIFLELLGDRVAELCQPAVGLSVVPEAAAEVMASLGKVRLALDRWSGRDGGLVANRIVIESLAQHTLPE